MQTVRVYNMTLQPVVLRGLGTVSAASKREGAINQITFDDNFNDYAIRAAAMGIVILDTAGLYVALAESPATYYLNYRAITGITSLDAANRSMVVTNAGLTYEITLPSAAAVAAGTILYFYYDSVSGGVTIAADGLETIDGLTDPLDLDSTAPNKVRRLQSDGVSNWTSV